MKLGVKFIKLQFTLNAIFFAFLKKLGKRQKSGTSKKRLRF
jgi:hypothetical protein